MRDAILCNGSQANKLSVGLARTATWMVRLSCMSSQAKEF